MEESGEQKLYEIGYLLVPFLATEQVPEIVEKVIKAKILADGGEVTSELAPKMIRLAYSMTKVISNKHTKFSDAYFAVLRFKAKPKFVIKFEKDLVKDENIIRHLLTLLSKGEENINAVKRSFMRQSSRAGQSVATGGRDDQPFEIERVAPKKEIPSVMTSEELDKEIEKLIV